MDDLIVSPDRSWLEISGHGRSAAVFDFRNTGYQKTLNANAANFKLTTSLNEASIKGFYSSATKAAFQSRVLPSNPLWSLEGRHEVYCGIYNSACDRFFSGSHDGVVRVFDASSRYFRLLESITSADTHWSVVSLNLSPDERHFVYSILSNRVYIVTITETHYISQPIDTGDLSGQTYSICFNGAGTHLISGQEDGNLSLCDISTGVWTRILASPSRRDINAVTTVDPAGHIILAGGDDTNIRVFDTRAFDKGALAVFPGHLDGITYLDPKMDQFYFLSNSKDQTIRLWDLRKHCLPGRERHLRSSCSWDYRVHPVPTFYSTPRRPRSGSVRGDLSVLTLRGHSVRFTLIRAKFSPARTTGQRYVYAGSSSGGWCIWDLMTGELVNRYSDGSYAVRDVSWHDWEPIVIASQMNGAMTCWSYPFGDDDCPTIPERCRFEQADLGGRYTHSLVAESGLRYRFPEGNRRSPSPPSPMEFAFPNLINWETSDIEHTTSSEDDSTSDNTDYREMLGGREFSSSDDEDDPDVVQRRSANGELNRPRTRSSTRGHISRPSRRTQPDERV